MIDVGSLKLSSKDLDRFDRYTYPEPNSGCFIWTGFSCTHGYGQFRLTIGKGKSIAIMAHRLSWVISGRALNKGDFLCHKCDTPCCINPDHLFIGGYPENQADMARKGRGTKSRQGFPYGVVREMKRGKIRFRAQIKKDGKLFRFGTFTTIDEAAASAIKNKEILYGKLR